MGQTNKSVKISGSGLLIVETVHAGNQLVSHFDQILDIISIVEENSEEMVIEIRLAGQTGQTQTISLEKNEDGRLILSPEFKELKF